MSTETCRRQDKFQFLKLTGVKMVSRLEQLCAVKVGVLWLNRTNTSANVADLPVSQSVCNLLEKTIENLRFYLFVWNLRYDNSRDQILLNAVNHIRWLGDGKIDELATIKNVLDDDTIDINLRFQQGCYHSIVDRIERLWIKLPRGSFYLSGADNVVKYDNRVVTYWLRVIGGEQNFDETQVSMEALEDAIVIQSLNSVKFFWAKLNQQQRFNVGMKAAARLDEMKPFPRPGTFQFVFNNFNESEAFQFISFAHNSHTKASSNILRALLYRTDNEMGKKLLKAGVTQQFVPEHDFLELCITGVDGNWTEEAFCLLWLCSSPDQKDFVTGNWQLATILTKLLKLENFAGIKLILQHIDGRKEITEQLIFSGPTSNLIWHLALEQNWVWLDYFLCTWLPKLPQSIVRLKRILDFEKLKLKEAKICQILNLHLNQWMKENLSQCQLQQPFNPMSVIKHASENLKLK